MRVMDWVLTPSITGRPLEVVAGQAAESRVAPKVGVLSPEISETDSRCEARKTPLMVATLPGSDAKR